MSANTIRNVLSLLQDDPERAEAWARLRETFGVNEAATKLELPNDLVGQEAEIASLLEKAREAHVARREFESVAVILAIEVLLARRDGAAAREAELVAQLARVRDEEVLDDAGARAAYQRLLELRPGDPKAEEFIETSDAKRTKWADIVAKYVEEAKQTSDAGFKASMLVGAAEVAYRFGRPQLSTGKKKKQLPALIDEVISGLREAVAIDPKSARAVHVLERVLRRRGAGTSWRFSSSSRPSRRRRRTTGPRGCSVSRACCSGRSTRRSARRTFTRRCSTFSRGTTKRRPRLWTCSRRNRSGTT